jgi:hypothetical protein
LLILSPPPLFLRNKMQNLKVKDTLCEPMIVNIVNNHKTSNSYIVCMCVCFVVERVITLETEERLLTYMTF